jgi:hypothetical protein
MPKPPLTVADDEKSILPVLKCVLEKEADGEP